MIKKRCDANQSCIKCNQSSNIFNIFLVKEISGGPRVHLGFSLISYETPKANFLANPMLFYTYMSMLLSKSNKTVIESTSSWPKPSWENYWIENVNFSFLWSKVLHMPLCKYLQCFLQISSLQSPKSIIFHGLPPPLISHGHLLMAGHWFAIFIFSRSKIEICALLLLSSPLPPPICIRWFPNLYLSTNFLSCAPVLHLLLPEWHEHIYMYCHHPS